MLTNNVMEKEKKKTLTISTSLKKKSIQAIYRREAKNLFQLRKKNLLSLINLLKDQPRNLIQKLIKTLKRKDLQENLLSSKQQKNLLKKTTSQQVKAS